VMWPPGRSGCGLGDGTQMAVDLGRGNGSREFIMEDGRLASLRPASLPSDLGPVEAVSVGGRHCLVLKADGTVVECGSRRDGLIDVPDGLSDVVAIATGTDREGHCLALRVDGTVVAWGENSSGQCDVPRGLDDAVAIAAGWRHSLALRAGGTVIGWGGNWSGQRTPPEHLAHVVAIAAGYDHSLALKGDGTVVGWGSNESGKCGPPAGLGGVVAIAAGQSRSLALKADGTVAAWGRNDQGQCDFAAAQTGVIAMTCRDGYDCDSFLVSLAAPDAQDRAMLPIMPCEPVVVGRLTECCGHVLNEFDLDLNDSLNELSGAKALLESVLTLGMPDSLEQDDLLRGFVFGSGSIIDRDGAALLVLQERDRLSNAWRLRESALKQAPWDRVDGLRRRIHERLDAMEESGRPEIPRMVGHTLSLLRLLREAY
jgi:hypothetical protein